MKHDTSTAHYLTIAEVAERLRLSVRSVRALVAAQRIPVIRVSARRIVVDSHDLDRYIDSRREGSR